MFNQARFNSVPFNRPNTLDVFLSAKLDGAGSLSAAPSVTFSVTAVLNGEGTLSANFTREIVYDALMNGEGSLSATALREAFGGATLNGEGTFKAIPKKFRIESLTINGPIAPGDKVVIDSRMLRILKNGEYVPYDGDFFDLFPGDNEITYTDTATGRTVRVRITWRDRYL